MALKTKEEILAAVTDALHDTFGIDRSKLTPDANLYQDLDIDSIDAIDMMVKLQKMIGKRLQPEAFKSIRTIGDVADVIVKLVNE